MPFLTAPFITRLQESFDKDYADFKSPTEGELGVSEAGIKIPTPPVKWATAWSEATELGAKGLMSMPIFPPVNNLALGMGKKAMYSVLITNTPYTPPYAILKQGFVAFSGAILLGWMPTYAAAPPGGPPNFESLGAFGSATTVNLPWITQCANMLSQWFLTGALIPTPAGISAVSAIPSNWL